MNKFKMVIMRVFMMDKIKSYLSETGICFQI